MTKIYATIIHNKAEWYYLYNRYKGIHEGRLYLTNNKDRIPYVYYYPQDPKNTQAFGWDNINNACVFDKNNTERFVLKQVGVPNKIGGELLWD